MKRLIYTFALLFVTLSMMAAKIPSGTQLYLKPNSNWKSDNAWFAAYFFGDGTAWVKMLDNDGDGIHSCKAPNSGKNYTNVIFCRINPSSKETSGSSFPNNCWNQTGNLIWDGTNSLFSILDWGSGSWSKASISYFTGGDVLYLKPSDNWKLDNARFAVNFFSDFGESWVSMKKAFFDDTYHVEIPLGDWTKLIFCRMDGENQTNDWDNKWNQSSNLFYDGKNNLFTIPSNSWNDATTTWSVYSSPIGNLVSYYVAGTMNNWTSNGTQMSFVSVEQGACCSFENLKKGTHQFKVTDGTWNWSKGHNDFDKDNSHVTSSSNNDGNVNFKLENDVAYLDIYLSLDFKISVKLRYNLNVSAQENGTVIGAGTYDHGTQVTIKAIPNDGYHFVKWSDGNTNASRIITVTENTTYEAIFDKLCEFDELTEGTVYYIAAETINVANKYDKASIDMEKTSVDGLYQVTIPKGYFDRFVIGDKTFTSAQISTNQYYNGMEWLPYKASLDIPNQTPNSGLFGTITYQKTISGDDVKKWHWISLPYNVKISDIKGGVYGIDFIIQKYDTEARAKWENNIAAENKSAWRWMDDSETLLAGKGYILAVSDAKDSYSLTFVSETDLNVVSDRFEGNNIDYSSAVAESANWHLVGTGVYGSVGDYEGVNYVAVPQSNGNDYDYYSLSEGSNNRLAPYSAFFVQYAGDYFFTKASGEQPALAPRLAKKVDDVERYYVDIKGESEEAQTAIFLAVDGTEDYVVGQDFLHLGASGASLQLYSLQGQNILSFNYLQSVERTIALGGYIAKGGIYEISLRAIGNATSIVLYDKFTGEGIDLLTDIYEFEAEKGAIDGRFEIIISYAQQGGTTTEFGGEDFGNLSVLLNNELVVFEGLTLGEDVMIYDVMGRCVKLFKATEQKAEICLVGGAYLLHHNNETIKFIVNK